jgi:4-amino-4-deoxy-L-arabinose transferase-like glycosyltransferase
MSWSRRRVGHVTALVATILVCRILLFRRVGIWGDYGFYVYNSRLILQGQAPFVDFLGRSPAFIYLLAGLRALVGHPTILPRAFITVLWTLTTIPVYLLASELHSHRAGLAAGALFGLSPFGLVYGMWTNTQSLAAFCATWAVYGIIRGETARWWGVAGAVFAVAYLSRRSVFVVAGAVGIWLVYRSYRDRAPRRVLYRGGAAVGAGLATLILGYGAIVGFDPEMTWRFFEVHTINLFISFGRGGYPLLTESAPVVTNQLDAGRIPIFNDVCQMCGQWTIRTFAKTTLVVAPTVGILAYYVRDLTTGFTQAQREYSAGIMATLAVYAVYKVIRYAYLSRALAIVGLALFVWAVYSVDRLDRELIYGPRLQVVLLILGGLTAGYLYRNRVLHTYYFMDFWPWVSVLASIIFIAVWQQADIPVKRVLVVALVVSSVAATASAHPLTNVVLDDNEDGWFTYENLDRYQEDINARTDPGDVVLATSPAYLAGTHAKLPDHNARIHMVLVRYKDYGPAVPLYADLIERLRTGSVEYIVYSRTMRQIMQWNRSLEHAFERNYCRVSAVDERYQDANAYLFRHEPDCPSERQPDINMTVVNGSGDDMQVRKNG